MIKKMMVSLFLMLTIGGSLIVSLIYLSETAPSDEEFDERMERINIKIEEYKQNADNANGF